MYVPAFTTLADWFEIIQWVSVTWAFPKVSVHPVAATLPTVMVPHASDESAESEGDVPQEESTGTVDEACKWPYWSMEKRDLRDEVACTVSMGPVVDPALSVRRFTPKRLLIVVEPDDSTLKTVTVEDPIAKGT